MMTLTQTADPTIYGLHPGFVVEEHQNGVDWLMIHGVTYEVSLEPRPHYCDRGNWIAKLFIHDPGDSLGIDDQEGWPRYYFDRGRALAEIQAWFRKRDLIPPVVVDLEGLVYNDELYVDGYAYTGLGFEWAPLTSVAIGDAATYPYKARLSNGATGQYRASEILARRRPPHIAAALEESEAHHPGFLAEMIEQARWPK